MVLLGAAGSLAVYLFVPEPAQTASLVGVGLAVVLGIPGLLQRHFQRIFRLRYRDLNVHQALRELAPWRPLIGKSAYFTLRGNMLAEAGLVDSLGQLLERPDFPRELRENCRALYYRLQEDWPRAEEALRGALSDAPESNNTANKVELAVHLAQYRPEALAEAWSLWDDALKGPCVEGAEVVMLSCEAPLWLAGGQPDIALRILEKHLPTLETRTAEDVSLLPFLAHHRQWLARTRWALGEIEPAREELIRARETYRGPVFQGQVDKDLKALANQEPLVDFGPTEPTEERAASFQLRERWPGGYSNLV